jgi:hypothetical protein
MSEHTDRAKPHRMVRQDLQDLPDVYCSYFKKNTPDNPVNPVKMDSCLA